MRGKQSDSSVIVHTYSYVVLKFNSARRVELDLLQSLPNNIVGLPLALLGGLDRCGLVNVALVINVKPSKGVR